MKSDTFDLKYVPTFLATTPLFSRALKLKKNSQNSLRHEEVREDEIKTVRNIIHVNQS